MEMANSLADIVAPSNSGTSGSASPASAGSASGSESLPSPSSAAASGPLSSASGSMPSAAALRPASTGSGASWQERRMSSCRANAVDHRARSPQRPGAARSGSGLAPFVPVSRHHHRPRKHTRRHIRASHPCARSTSKSVWWLAKVLHIVANSMHKRQRKSQERAEIVAHCTVTKNAACLDEQT